MYLRIAGTMITVSAIILTEHRCRTITENPKDLATSFKSSFIPGNLLTYTRTTAAYAPTTLYMAHLLKAFNIVVHNSSEHWNNRIALVS